MSTGSGQQIGKNYQAFVIVDTPESTAVVQVGQPSTHMGAWTIDVPIAGSQPAASDLDNAVQAWLHSNPPPVPMNSAVYACWTQNTGVAGLSYAANYQYNITLTRV